MNDGTSMEKPEEKVTLTVHEPVTATFPLRHLINFAKAAPLSGVVELGMDPDAPLLQDHATQDKIRGVYERRNPAKLSDLEGLFEKYKGRELALYQRVCAKYGEETS